MHLVRIGTVGIVPACTSVIQATVPFPTSIHFLTHLRDTIPLSEGEVVIVQTSQSRVERALPSQQKPALQRRCSSAGRVSRVMVTASF